MLINVYKNSITPTTYDFILKNAGIYVIIEYIRKDKYEKI